jgi:hypothetical protein
MTSRRVRKINRQSSQDSQHTFTDTRDLMEEVFRTRRIHRPKWGG